MIPIEIIATISLLYFALLFAVAYYADQRRRNGQSITANNNIYALSLAVYCTSWTFYGSVGRAATSGLDFLPVYLGPTLIAFSWWFLLRKMVRISKEHNIVSIADFISSRYGKSAYLGGIVTIFAILGIVPYIALQLKAVAFTFDLIAGPPEAIGHTLQEMVPILPSYVDTAFIVAMFLALFGVLFGARHLDASERHEGLVAAIAFESIIKLLAFLAVGIFITYGLFDGFGDIFSRFQDEFPNRVNLLLLDTPQIPYASWFTMVFISMMAIMFLPRQFHIMVIENSAEEHIKYAMWKFPAYLFLINLFVIPIALAGLLMNGGDTSNADYFLIHLPQTTGHPWLALLVFIGGFSASAGMVMVESVASSNMLLNHLMMPVILKLRFKASDLSGILINLKRLGIVFIIFFGYLYYRIIGESTALVSTGLISFVAASQFAPSLIGGLYWRRANHLGASTGLICGFVIWFYTLVIPSFVRSGWLESDILENGLFGFTWLRPLELFGLSGFDMWTHALFWSMFFNLGGFLALSLLTPATNVEREQAEKFVDAFGPVKEDTRRKRISRAPNIMEFVDLMTKFIGEKQAHTAIAEYLGDREIDARGSLSEYEIPNLKRFTERTLAGSVGAAPARIILENYLAARGSKMEDVFDIFGTVNLSRTASRDQLSVLYEAARVVASGADLQTILDNILDLLQQQFRFDLCVIRILDENRKILTVRSQKGMSSEHLGSSERELTTDTCIGTTFLTNQVTMANDSEAVDLPISAEILHREGIKSFAHAPITIEGQPIGVLSAFSRTAKGIFTDEFIELFKSLAGQVGVAWRNSQQTGMLIEARQQERELQIAKNIQLSLLPATIPEIPGIQLAGICVPTREVGGDYYDFIQREAHIVDLVIGDVSGHNIGASLIMAETRTFIQAKARDLHRPNQILYALNDFFYEDLTRTELFITLFYLTYNAKSRELCFSSAGHNPPIIWRSSTGTCQRLDAEGLILGVNKEVVFEENKEQLNAGDILLLYTDGIIEAENKDGQFFGEERLCDILHDNQNQTAEVIIENLLNQIRLFTGDHTFRDDVTMVVMRVLEK